MLAFLYGLSLYAKMPAYIETIVFSAVLLIAFGAGLLRLVPALSSMLMGEEESHMVKEGDRTYRRCGTRELFKLFLLVLLARALEFPLTYAVHFLQFGYQGTFFEVQRLWLDFYSPETAFPLYGYLSNIFWIFTVNYNHARFIGSYFFTALAVVALYYLVQLDYDRKTARRSVRYFLLLPFSAVLMATVPDGLMLLFSVLCLLFIRKRMFPLANLFAMLATMTDAFGVLLFLPVLASYISFLIGNIRSNREMEKGYFLKQVGNALSFLLVPIGVGLVVLYSALRFHDATALYAQAFSGAGVGISPLFDWSDAALQKARFVGGDSTKILLGTYLPQAVALVFGTVMLLLSVGTLPTSYSLLMAAALVMTVAVGRVGDAARIITVTAPFPIALAARVKNRWIDAVITVLLLAAWIAYFYVFIAGATGGIA